MDGLRGWAALMVASFHIFWESFGVVAPWVRNPVTAFLFDGGLAVAIFFVLSGEALATPYFKGGSLRAIASLAIRRYPRLTIPILASCAIVFLIAVTGLNLNHQAGAAVRRPEWLGSWLATPQTARNLILFSTWQVYLDASVPSSLNPFLWTMRIELLGSGFVLFALYLIHYRRSGYLLLIISIPVLVLARGDFGQLACFPAGMLLAAARQKRWMYRIQIERWSTPVSVAAIAVTAACDVFHPWSIKGPGEHPTGLYAIVICTALSVNAPARKFLSNTLSQFLGNVSFPLFLMQFPILVSIGSWLLLWSARNSFSWVSVLIAGSAILVCEISAAVAFEPVDRFTRWIGVRLSHTVLHQVSNFSRCEDRRRV